MMKWIFRRARPRTRRDIILELAEEYARAEPDDGNEVGLIIDLMFKHPNLTFEAAAAAVRKAKADLGRVH